MNEKKDLQPGPGQVIVLRDEISDTIDGISKPLMVIQREEQDNIKAVIARTGEDTGDQPLQRAWWNEGDTVIIAPHVFTRVDLDGGESFWLGPFIGVKARFA